MISFISTAIAKYTTRLEQGLQIFQKHSAKKKPRHPPDRTKMDAISNLPVNSVRNIRSQWQTVTYAASLIPGQDRI